LRYSGEYFITVRNLKNGRTSLDKVGSCGDGKFLATLIDMSKSEVVKAGDLLEVTAIDVHGKVVAGPLRHLTTEYEIARAYSLVELRLGDVIPERSILLQNYPNPFNPETWIPFRLAEDADVTIRIYDIQGRLVKDMVLGRLEAGIYEQRDRAAYWDGRNEQGEQVSSGVYIIKLSTTGAHTVRKACLIK
jgi:hypothetical protein